MAPLTILHTGWGYRPLRSGGLIAYTEDLMAAQVREGHRVGYFCNGRRYPGLRRPRLRRFERAGIEIFEVLNVPQVREIGGDRGTLTPELDLDDPDIERHFERVLSDVRPDVLHVQELFGLPSSLLEIARERGVPVVMTLQDYFPLCPTLKLFDSHGAVNLRTEVGAECARCCANAPTTYEPVVRSTLNSDARRLSQAAPALGRALAAAAPVANRLLGAARALAAKRAGDGPAPAAAGEGEPLAPSEALIAAYQRRREVNVERLSGVDRLVPMSARVGEIYAALGVDAERLAPRTLTLAHIESLRPREPRPPGTVLRLATLNGFSSVEKGGDVLLGAVERLRADGYGGRFELLALGHVAPYADRLAALGEVRVIGDYGPGGLDGLLDDVDVGIVPSIWEEAYGYVGPELLAKGIPIIGNAIGGIVEYVREGETGWRNDSCSAEELAAIVARLIDRPEEVRAMGARVLERRPEIVKPHAEHVAEMDALYAEVIRERAARRPATVG